MTLGLTADVPAASARAALQRLGLADAFPVAVSGTASENEAQMCVLRSRRRRCFRVPPPPPPSFGACCATCARLPPAR